LFSLHITSPHTLYSFAQHIIPSHTLYCLCTVGSPIFVIRDKLCVSLVTYTLRCRSYILYPFVSFGVHERSFRIYFVSLYHRFNNASYHEFHIMFSEICYSYIAFSLMSIFLTMDSLSGQSWTQRFSLATDEPFHYYNVKLLPFNNKSLWLRLLLLVIIDSVSIFIIISKLTEWLCITVLI